MRLQPKNLSRIILIPSALSLACSSTYDKSSEVDVEQLQARVEALEGASSDGDGGTGGVDDGATNSELSDSIAQLEQELASVPELQTRLEELESDLAMVTELVGNRFIDDNLTLRVGSGEEFADIIEALAYLDDKVISSGAIVRIEVDAGTYIHSTAIRPSHPQGSRIEIVGNEDDPSSVTLEFPSSSGVVMEHGAHLRYFAGFRLVGAGAGNGASGFWMSDNSGVYVGALQVDNFHVSGVKVTTGSSLRETSDDGIVAVTNSGGNGFEVTGPSTLAVPGASSSDNYVGFWAASGGVLSATGAYAGNTSTGGQAVGFAATFGSVADVRNSDSSDNLSRGFAAYNGSFMLASDSTASGNGETNYYAVAGSVLLANDTESAGNVTDHYSARSHSHINAEYSEASGAGSDHCYDATWSSYMSLAYATPSDCETGISARWGSINYVSSNGAMPGVTTDFEPPQESNSWLYAANIY